MDDARAAVAVKQAIGLGYRLIGCGDAMLSDPAIVAIAHAHDNSPAQIILRRHVQSGYGRSPSRAIPGGKRPNPGIFDFTLSEAEMAVLNAMDHPDPEMLDSGVFGH